MNRTLFVLALFLFAAPSYSMMATVMPSAPTAAPTAPGNGASTKSATTTGATGARSDTASAAPTKITMPDAAAVTRRSASSPPPPGVPMKSNTATGARSGGARSTAILPSAPPQAAASPGATSANWAPVGDNSASMHRGTVQAISASAGTLSVYGQKLTFNAQRVKVFNRDGKTGSIFSLKSGANIRYTLDPTDPLHRRVAVIYLS